jgi:hypothetical protein
LSQPGSDALPEIFTVGKSKIRVVAVCKKGVPLEVFKQIVPQPGCLPVEVIVLTLNQSVT